MAQPFLTKRVIFSIGGYDIVPPATAHHRFARELRRFETTWSLRATVSDCAATADEAVWTIRTDAPNWASETEFHLMRWDDLIAQQRQGPRWRRILRGAAAFGDVIGSGAFLGYVRSNWRYALFFLYPYLLLAILAGLALGLGLLVGRIGGAFGLVGGVLAGCAAFAVLVRWPGDALNLPHLLDDWIFAADYARDRAGSELARRLDLTAQGIVAAARARQADEILVVGHSLGAVLATDALARALASAPEIGAPDTRVRLLTIGSSLLKIGFMRHARSFHRAVAAVAQADHLPWAEYQARMDVMNFFKSDPVALMGLGRLGRPIVRTVRLRSMLEPATYQRMQRNFFRLHCQFISGNDRRAPYDYFMILLGPLPFLRFVQSRDGAQPFIAADGALLDPAPQGTEP